MKDFDENKKINEEENISDIEPENEDIAQKIRLEAAGMDIPDMPDLKFEIPGSPEGGAEQSRENKEPVRKKNKRLKAWICTAASAAAAAMIVIAAAGGFNSKSASPAVNLITNDYVGVPADYMTVYGRMNSVAPYLNAEYAASSVSADGASGMRETVQETAAASALAEKEGIYGYPDAETVTEESALGDGGDYSETNVQTEGIDEADVVKTDGQYIYALYNTWYGGEGHVRVIKAEGTDMEVVSVIIPQDATNCSISINDMYVSGDRLIITGQTRWWTYSLYDDDEFYAVTEAETSSAYKPEYQTDAAAEEELVSENMPSLGSVSSEYLDDYEAYVFIYDISDRAQPYLMSVNTQSGYYETSRLTDGYLYIVSSYHLNTLAEDHCVPIVNGCLVECDSIYLPEYIINASYTVVTSTDINDPDGFTDTFSYAGELYSSSSLYMSADNIYLMSYCSEETDITDTPQGAEYIAEVQNDISRYLDEDHMELVRERVKRYMNTGYMDQKIDEARISLEFSAVIRGDSTQICRISFDRGNLKLEANGKISGSAGSNLCYDEYKGYLRLVNTGWRYASVYAYAVFTGPDGEEIYRGLEAELMPQSYGSGVRSAVHVLDADLNEKALIDDIAKGETLKSVRFFGDYGYFVTYLQTDPLFAVDFSDIENPVIAGELEIPGFSQYLHFYSENELLGIGIETESEGSSSGSIKLEMYDISNGSAAVITKEVLEDANEAPCLYDYKAALISPSRNMIGFYTIDWSPDWSDSNRAYYIYSYEDGEFVQTARVDIQTPVYNDYDVRGLYIDHYFYVVLPDYAIYAFDLDDPSHELTSLIFS